MRTLIIIGLLIIGFTSRAQSTGEFMLGGGIDLIKTDINQVFDKAQAGIELNYFISRKFSVNGGFEFWTDSNNSLAIGFRWYPINNFFVRYRGLIGVDDFAFGVGYSRPLSSQFRAELMGDYFINGQDFAMRAGVAYIFRSKDQE